MIPSDFNVSASVNLLVKCWELAKKNYALILGVSILSFIIHKVVSVVPLVGVVVSPVVAVLFYAGILRITKYIQNQEGVVFDELFYFFKMQYERSRLIHLGLLTAAIIFVLRVLMVWTIYIAPFTAGIEFIAGIVESFALFFVSILILPEMILNGHELRPAINTAKRNFISHWPFFLGLLMISWLLALACTLLFIVPFFIVYLPIMAFLPIVIHNQMKSTVYF